MKQIHKRLTYANVMSSIAVFLVIGGGAAFAALGKNTVGAKQLKKNAVTNPKIADNAVRTGELADNAVTATELADAAVTLAKLANDSVTSAKIANAAVTSSELADAAVTLAKLAGNSVDASKVVDNTLAAADLAPNSVTSSEIATDAVNATEIADNSIDGGEIVDSGLSDLDVGNASGTFVFNAASVAANGCTVVAPVVAGVDNNDHVLVSPPPSIMELNLSVTSGRSTSDGFIRLNFCNPTASAIDPPSATYNFVTINQ